MFPQILLRVGQVSVGMAFVGAIGRSALYKVGPGKKAIIFNRFTGIDPDVIIDEGTHFHLPWFQLPIIFETRTQSWNETEVLKSKDWRTIKVTISLKFRPDPNMLPKIYTNIGANYEARVIPLVIQEVLKKEVEQYPLKNLMKPENKEIFTAKVAQSMQEHAAKFGIILEHVSIEELSAI